MPVALLARSLCPVSALPSLISLFLVHLSCPWEKNQLFPFSFALSQISWSQILRLAPPTQLLISHFSKIFILSLKRHLVPGVKTKCHFAVKY